MPALAAPTDGYVYSKDASTLLGEEFELPIAIKNTEFRVKSFQFTITLPDGISFVSDGEDYMYKLESDYAKWSVNYATVAGEPTNTAVVMVSYQKNQTTCIEKGDNIVLNLILKADENVDLENTTISLSKEIVTLEDGTATHPLADGETITSVVTEASLPEMYSLEILPAKINAGEVAALDLNYTAPADILSFSFDIKFSSTNILGTYTFNVNRLNNASFSGFFQTSTSGNTVSGTSPAASMLYVKKGYGKLYTIQVLSTAEGKYIVELTNIVFKDVNNNTYSAESYSADIYVGTPKAPVSDGEIAFYGNYSNAGTYSLLTTALSNAADEVITTANLNNVTALPAGTDFSVGNPNAIIRCAKDLGLTQDNVVIGDECASLVLTDGYAFKNTEAFTATSASYTRKMDDHSWGTLCLPFAVTNTNANVYTLSSVTTGENGEMKFTQAASAAVEANTPYVIKKDADEVTFTASDVEVPATPADSKVATSVAGWTLIGTTTDLNVADLSKAYFINGDHFWKAGSSLHVAPFRAYFEGASSAAKFRIAEETNGIETIENEAEAGVIYDLQGRAVKAAQAGQVYVQGAKKFIVK